MDWLHWKQLAWTHSVDRAACSGGVASDSVRHFGAKSCWEGAFSELSAGKIGAHCHTMGLGSPNFAHDAARASYFATDHVA